MTATITCERRTEGARQAAEGMPSDDRAGAASTGAASTGERGLQTLKQAVTAVLSSPSLLDGFNGARDAGILDTSAKRTLRQIVKGGIVRVQCTQQTEPMLCRAGIKRPVRFEAYEVKVMKDGLGRYQLAPISTEGGLE